MPVQAVGTQATQSQSVSEASQKATLDYDAFLQLMVAEMQYQDPTKPMDSSQYMAQLASFSSVEQAIQTNARLDTVIANLAMAQGPATIGKTVTSADGSQTGVVTSVQFFSDSVVATLESGAQVKLGPGVRVSN